MALPRQIHNWNVWNMALHYPLILISAPDLTVKMFLENFLPTKGQSQTRNTGPELYDLIFHSYLKYFHSNKTNLNVKIHLHLLEAK